MSVNGTQRCLPVQMRWWCHLFWVSVFQHIIVLTSAGAILAPHRPPVLPVLVRAAEPLRPQLPRGQPTEDGAAPGTAAAAAAWPAAAGAATERQRSYNGGTAAWQQWPGRRQRRWRAPLSRSSLCAGDAVAMTECEVATESALKSLLGHSSRAAHDLCTLCDM